MQNRVYYVICLYVCMDGTYAPKMCVGGTFFSKKHVFLGLTPAYSETTALSKSYFKLKLQIVREFLLVFQVTKSCCDRLL